MRVFSVLFSLGLLSGSALAADLLEPVVPVEPVVVPEAFSWTGGYVGLNAGWAFGAGDDDDGDLFIERTNGRLGRALSGDGSIAFIEGDFNRARRTTFIDGDEMNGPFLGAQTGFNYQAGIFVIGVEGDIQWANIDDDSESDAGTLDVFTGVIGGIETAVLNGFVCRELVTCEAERDRTVQATVESSVGWFGTARLRAGLGLDRALIYATGGLAFGDTSYDVQINGQESTRITRGLDETRTYRERFGIRFEDDDDTEFGYALGGGIEYAFTDNVSVKAEYQYVNLGGGLFGDHGDNGGVIRGDGTRDLQVTIRDRDFQFDRTEKGRFNAQIDEPEVNLHTLRAGVNVLF